MLLLLQPNTQLAFSTTRAQADSFFHSSNRSPSYPPASTIVWDIQKGFVFSNSIPVHLNNASLVLLGSPSLELLF